MTRPGLPSIGGSLLLLAAIATAAIQSDAAVAPRLARDHASRGAPSGGYPADSRLPALPARPWSFANQILPVLTKAGCNSGGCHGRAAGQNGFKLSLLGFDPRVDYEALVFEARGRRLQRAAPEASLFLRKGAGRLPHGGGQRLQSDSPDYRLLLDWLRAGAPYGSDDVDRLVRISMTPRERELRAGESVSLQVTAHYSDGRSRDVTAHVLYSSNQETVVGVDEAGRVRAGARPGEAAVMARYMGQVAVARFRRPRPGSGGVEELPVANAVDAALRLQLLRLRIAPSAPCSDAEFLRRVYLDVIGTLPTSAEARAFLTDPRPDRRALLVDALLERPEYADYWALRWADVLRLNRDQLGAKGAYVFHRWLRQQMAVNAPYDAFVRQLVTARGDSGTYGPANLYRALRSPEEAASTISQVFLGLRIQCAQCHHHPYEKWSQNDFYGMVAYFTRLQRKSTGPDAELIYAGGTAEAVNPRTRQVVAPRPLGGTSSGEEEVDGDRREALAAWLTGPPDSRQGAYPHSSNPWLARMAANRIWAHFMGHGLVDPVDDMRETNPASNEPLLERLARTLRDHRYDLKALIRLIVTSNAYQLSARPNATNDGDEQSFSRRYGKPLSAEVLLDAICQATGVPEKFPGFPLGTRAIQLWDNRLPSYFLEIFGRPVRATPCECERSQEPSMAQALHLMNAPGIQAKIADRHGRVRDLVRSAPSIDAIVEELYLATWSRFPTPPERARARALFARRGDRRTAAEDLLWALLNSRQFLLNY